MDQLMLVNGTKTTYMVRVLWMEKTVSMKDTGVMERSSINVLSLLDRGEEDSHIFRGMYTKVIGMMIILKEWELIIITTGLFIMVNGRMKKETGSVKKSSPIRRVMRENLSMIKRMDKESSSGKIILNTQVFLSRIRSMEMGSWNIPMEGNLRVYIKMA